MAKFKALTDLSLRQSPDPKSPLFNEWHEWKAGTVFEAPDHMNMEKCLERGIVEPAKGAKITAPAAFEPPAEEVTNDDEG